MLVIRGQKNQENALKNEWLESNIHGSYIYNNLLCCNTQPMHSLLTIPFQDKLITLVSSVDEEININNRAYSINPSGKGRENDNYLEKFYLDEHPNFIYNFNGVKLLKSILLVNNMNITIIKYELLQSDNPSSVILSISPLISVKEHDSKTCEIKKFKYNIVKEPDYVKFIGSNEINIFFYFNKGEFNKHIHNNFTEKEEETHLSPGAFTCQLTPGENEYWFSISSERLKDTDISAAFYNEVERRKTLQDKITRKNQLYRNIILSSSFYINRKDNISLLRNSLLNPTISFQTMIISLTILFTLKRIDTLKDILKFLGSNIKQGIIPEQFDNNKKVFTYNSIDNSFWYLLNLLKFIEYTGDWKFIKDHLWEKIKLIIHNFHDTISGIRVDTDGLLLCDINPDERFNKDKLIEYTPGKHIALNILWYNAIRIIEILSARFADIEYHTRAIELGFTIKKKFFSKFWNKEKGYFNNSVDIPHAGGKDNSLRPYQVFLVSLPFDDLILYKTKQQILEIIKDKLLTPYGLMTLSNDSKKYEGRSVYNGMSHPYLLFHYLSAVLKLNKYSRQAKKEVKHLLTNFEKKIKENIIGFFPQFTISDKPHESARQMDFSITMSE